MKRKLAYLVLVVLIVFSCKKTEPEPENSQLWLKVDDGVPNFTLKFKFKAVKNRENVYIVSYTDKAFKPDIKKFDVTEYGVNGSWIQVYNDLGRTDEIMLQLLNGKVYKARGFEFHEKRLIEIVSTSRDSLNIVDRDISIIEKFILVN